MKYEIEIVHLPAQRKFPYRAKVVGDNELPGGYGNTAAEAELDLIDQLRALETQEPTIIKEIEL